jgi:hypothetical protein
MFDGYGSAATCDAMAENPYREQRESDSAEIDL